MNRATRWLRRSRLRLADNIRYAPATSTLLAMAQAIQAALRRSPARRLPALMRAYRLAADGWLGRWLEPRVQRTIAHSDGAFARHQVGWNFYETVLQRPALDRTIVLKAPQPGGEKGVILVMLESNWIRLLARPRDASRLGEEFTFILSTGWSPTDYALLALAVERLAGMVYVQACNYSEIPRIERLHPRLRCLPTIACDWIDPRLYAPRPHSERQIDLLMVANWAPFKRHWQLFDALSRMPADLRITLVGQPERGHTLEHIRRLARSLGVKQQVRFVENAPIDDVTRWQCDSRTSLILSRREGCCVAVCESLFADSPVGLLRGAHVGPVAYINDQTGVLLEPRRLDRQLMRFIEHSDRYHPRRWAMQHITSDGSAERLNDLLRHDAKAAGQPWTSDLITPCWRPYPVYTRESDADQMRPIYDDLHERSPHLFRADHHQSVRPPAALCGRTGQLAVTH